MKVTLQYVDSCPNWKLVDQRIREVIKSHGLDCDLDYQLVDSPEAAEQCGFHGSPSMLVDGVDPFATEDTLVGEDCRIYRTESGPAGAPSVEQIAQALSA